jgi:transcriptional regulator with GAF, ATPase, and Fis domain
VLQALQATNGRKMAAAKLLNIDHRKLSRLIKKYNLQPTWK